MPWNSGYKGFCVHAFTRNTVYNADKVTLTKVRPYSLTNEQRKDLTVNVMMTLYMWHDGDGHYTGIDPICSMTEANWFAKSFRCHCHDTTLYDMWHDSDRDNTGIDPLCSMTEANWFSKLGVDCCSLLFPLHLLTITYTNKRWTSASAIAPGSHR